jgi:hypothetical protein
MMNGSSTGGNPTAEKIDPYVLLGMTAVTGLVDAVSFSVPRERRLRHQHRRRDLEQVRSVPGILTER